MDTCPDAILSWELLTEAWAELGLGFQLYSSASRPEKGMGEGMERGRGCMHPETPFQLGLNFLMSSLMRSLLPTQSLTGKPGNQF